MCAGGRESASTPETLTEARRKLSLKEPAPLRPENG